MFTVQQVIQLCSCIEDPLPHSHWGETAQMQTMQLFSQSGFQSKRHINKHTGEKPHQCNQCDYATINSDNLKKHRRTHSGGKPHRCTMCFQNTNDFSPSFLLLVAGTMRQGVVHTGEKPCICKKCEFTNTQNRRTRYWHSFTRMSYRRYGQGPPSQAR